MVERGEGVGEEVDVFQVCSRVRARAESVRQSRAWGRPEGMWGGGRGATDLVAQQGNVRQNSGK